ncbi:Tetratricopeptide repeat protein 1 [Nymphon striatum]|nr:Tetratricopeptide repeat protein 1 [Nymphon striatum]
MSTQEDDCAVSNEEIVNEITKDLETTLEMTNNNPTEDDDTNDRNEEKPSETENDSDSEYFSDENELENSETNKPKDTNDIHEDIEYRKEMEESLTDEEKEVRKIEAQALKDNGNELYKNESFEDAIKKYTEALLICPLSFAKDRSIMYSNRAACRVKLDKKETAITDCTQGEACNVAGTAHLMSNLIYKPTLAFSAIAISNFQSSSNLNHQAKPKKKCVFNEHWLNNPDYSAVELNPNYTKAFTRRAQLYEQTEKLDDALADYKKILELEPNNIEANQACMRLPQQINERNEKLKTEMMGKLKDLGNLFLRPFGLSTDNFQLNQNQDGGGGYSVNFQNAGNGPKT